MDLNADGHVDVLSGCYAITIDEVSAGYFYVMWGSETGELSAPDALKGTDGEYLLVSPEFPAAYCTRPTAVDINGDGNLDIVSGNFSGHFTLFLGEGDAKFQSEGTPLEDGDGNTLMVGTKSDPFFIDWDGDGDLDMLSGSSAGGVYYFANVGSKTEARFEKSDEWLAPPKAQKILVSSGKLQQPDDAPVSGPQQTTRVWAGDLNGDGKHDLLVGDRPGHVWRILQK